MIDGQEIFVYSTNPEDDLFKVKFSRVGKNQGDYVLTDHTTISRVYEYVSPVDGIPQGEYAPITRLFPPNQLQMAVINGRYHPSDKTDVKFELAGSSYDKNLFSDLDSGDNEGYAGHLEAKQNIFTAADNTKINAFAKVDFIQKDFESVEPLYNVEFDRDWNLEDPYGNHSLIDAGVEYIQNEHGMARYTFQKLDYSNFSGNRQSLNSHLKFGNLTTNINASYLNNKSDKFTSEFLRLNAEAVYQYKPFWTGVRFDGEDNQQIDKTTNELTGLSQRYQSYEVFTGVGDSTAVYAEVGYRYRVTDSLRNNSLQKDASAHNYYIKSQLLQSANSKLSVFLNYREVDRRDEENKKERSLNSRIRYNQYLFDRVVNWSTVYETNSGTLPQQEYTFVEVEPGQ